MKFTWRVEQRVREYAFGGGQELVYRITRSDGTVYAKCKEKTFADRRKAYAGTLVHFDVCKDCPWDGKTIFPK